MKTSIRFLFLIFVFVFPSTGSAQISNLLVNGSSTHFTVMSGGEMSWSYNLPVGGTALLEIWIDVNANTIVEPATDILWQAFYQMDGQQGYDGPPDMDGLVNGQISFGTPIGLAPAEYIMSFSNNSSTVAISGTITPLLSSVFTISGTVSVPPGNSAQNLIMNLESRSENGGKFWTAITDVNGNYSLYMDADTSGNPWSLRIDNEHRLSPAILSPNELNLVLNAGISTNYSGNNFTFSTAAAEVNGTVKDDDGNPIAGVDVFISGNYGAWDRNTRTDLTGSYRLGFLSSELPASNVWLGAGNSEDNSMVSSGSQLPTVNSGNVLTKNLFIYKTNSTITGTVTLNGNPPNMNLEIHASVSDTAFLRTYTEYNGNYTLNVTNKLYNYIVGPGYLPPNYMYNSVIAHPGQTNVNLNFNLTDVEHDQSVIPNEFSLLQNYPNPFNPSTKISWQTPVASWQSLKIYDILGKVVAILVDEEIPAGTHEVEFDAEGFTSGIYFYRLQTGNYSEMRKMILLR
jgi:hypothetical protein